MMKSDTQTATIIVLFICLLSGFASAADTAIVVPESTPPFKPIVARIVVPADPYIDVITTWSADEGTSFRSVRVNGADELDVWAAPGEHWLACIVVTHRYQEQVVLVPDEQDPTNMAKVKPKTIRVTLGTDVKQYRQSFAVAPLPVPPTSPSPPQLPPVDPPKVPPPTPSPTPPSDGDIAGLFGLAPKVRDKATTLVPAQHRGRSSALADVYRVAAIEVIDGKMGVLNVAKRLKELNGGALKTDDERDAWSPFLVWLGGEMTAMAGAGKLLSAKDVVAALSEISLGLSLVK